MGREKELKVHNKQGNDVGKQASKHVNKTKQLLSHLHYQNSASS